GETAVPASTFPLEVAARADLNSDGIIDFKDVEEFEFIHGLPNELSAKIKRSEQEARSKLSPERAPGERG
ncbi:MAG: hypothetical protein ACYTHJ_21035, partial [Planctomycetota bacterium]